MEMKGHNHEGHMHGMHEGHMDGGIKGMNHGGGMGHMMHMGNLKRKFWVSLALSIPVIILSPMMGMRLPFQFTFEGSQWVVLILSCILFFYGGAPFLIGAKNELKAKSPAMMTLIAMGICVSFFYSLYAFAANNIFHTAEHKMDYFWELSTLIVIMLLGHWIEMKAVGRAGGALKAIAALLPDTAHLVEDGQTKDIPVSGLKIGDSVLVKAGEKIPADGAVVSGESAVNESMITGESKRVLKKGGDKVFGGSVNGDGTITVKISGTGESGYLARMMRLVQSAQDDKSATETLADKVAKALFYVALAAGICAFVAWLAVTKDINTAITRMVTVFIIACPHALGLAIPLVVARSISLGAAAGILVKNRNAFEKSKKLSVACMDKTGTITEGSFQVVALKSLSDEMKDAEAAAVMAAMEGSSSHPLARGIVDYAKKLNIEIPKAENVKAINGIGLDGTVEGKNYKIVSRAYLGAHKIEIGKDENPPADASVSYLVSGNKTVGYVAQNDVVKPQAREAVAGIKELGVTPVMLTGDNKSAAAAVAKKVGINDVRAELSPEDKEKIVSALRNEGKTVMMVGDGINDAPSLARADISMAIGAGTDVAIESADVVLVNSYPMDIVGFIRLARNTGSKMVQNLWWAVGYNIFAIPLAAGVLAPIGITLSPAVGALLMSASTVIVAVNAMMLKAK